MDQVESHRVPRLWCPERNLAREGWGRGTPELACHTRQRALCFTQTILIFTATRSSCFIVTPFHRRGNKQREIRPMPKVPRPSAVEAGSAAPCPLCGLQGAQSLTLSRQPGANRKQAEEAPPLPRPWRRAPNYKGPRPRGGSRIPGAPGAYRA